MTISVQIDCAPAYELVVSLTAFVQKKLHKTLALGPPWVAQVARRLGSEWKQRFQVVELPALDLLLWQCPGPRDPEGFIAWLRSLSVGDLYELHAPYLPEGGPPLPVDLAGLRDRTAGMLELFWERYFRSFDPGLLAALTADAAEKRALLGAITPLDLVERVTGGVRIEPDAGVERVILIPQYHARPINTYTRFRGLRFYYYPADVPEPASGDVPPALTRLVRALGDESRLHILRLLAPGPLTFTELVRRGKLAKSTVHHHLVTLRAAGLLRVHEGRDGAWYSLRPDGLEALQPLLSAYIYQGRAQ